MNLLFRCSETFQNCEKCLKKVHRVHRKNDTFFYFKNRLKTFKEFLRQKRREKKIRCFFLGSRSNFLPVRGSKCGKMYSGSFYMRSIFRSPLIQLRSFFSPFSEFISRRMKKKKRKKKKSFFSFQRYMVKGIQHAHRNRLNWF